MGLHAEGIHGARLGVVEGPDIGTRHRGCTHDGRVDAGDRSLKVIANALSAGFHRIVHGSPLTDLEYQQCTTHGLGERQAGEAVYREVLRGRLVNRYRQRLGQRDGDLHRLHGQISTAS